MNRFDSQGLLELEVEEVRSGSSMEFRAPFPPFDFPHDDSMRWFRPNPSWQLPAAQPAVQDPPVSGAALLIGGLALVGLGYAIYSALSEDSEPTRRCSGCGSSSHDRRTCGYVGEPRHFSRSIPRAKRCECCGKYGYETHRHHPRGRADDSDWLDVCNGCHLQCCHKGDYNNFATKPRFCLFTGNTAFWRLV